MDPVGGDETSQVELYLACKQESLLRCSKLRARRGKEQRCSHSYDNMYPRLGKVCRSTRVLHITGRERSARAVKNYRKLFPIVTQATYLNHALRAPLSLPVVSAIKGFLEDQEEYLLEKRSDRQERIGRLRARLANLINASAEEIAVVRNTCEGLSIVANGLRWEEGDNVIVNTLEQGANAYPWMQLTQRFGVEVKFIPARDERVLVEDILAAVDDRTRVITVSFVEYTNGFRNDIDTIGGLCRERGIRFVVDAIQGLGVLGLDVGRSKIDFLAAGGHKWLLGPQGIGFFYCRKELLDQVWLSEAGHFSMVHPYGVTLARAWKLRPDARRFEGGVRNYCGIFGLDASVGLLQGVGISNIEAHVLSLTDYLVTRLQEKGYRVLSSRRPKERSGIVSFTHPKRESTELLQRLTSAGVVVSLREGMIRVSPHFYNNEDDIDHLIESLP